MDLIAGLKNGVMTGDPAPALLSIWRSRTESSDGDSKLTAYADPKEMAGFFYLHPTMASIAS